MRAINLHMEERREDELESDACNTANKRQEIREPRNERRHQNRCQYQSQTQTLHRKPVNIVGESLGYAGHARPLNDIETREHG